MAVSFVTPYPAMFAHWKKFEAALTAKLLEWVPPDKRLCEWVLLGVSETAPMQYIWVVCMEQPKPDGLFAVVSIPVRVHLDSDGNVKKLEIPGPGANYGPSIRQLFPKDVQEKIFNFQAWLDVEQLKAHLIYRFEHPETPPLIVLSTTPTP